MTDTVNEPNRREALQQLLFISGRPMPKVVVIGQCMARHCMVLDGLGGAAIGVAASPSALTEALLVYPGGTFLVGDPHDPPLEADTYDAAWTESAFSDKPRDQFIPAVRGVHRALRPGGLLALAMPAAWSRTELEAALDQLDFTFTRELPSITGAILVFRREY